MRLNDISDNKGARKAAKRVGRGIGSGTGKTAGRGHKGQSSRSGVGVAAFEGGQMPIYRRLPKRGFKSRNRVAYNEICLTAVQDAIDSGRLDAKKPITSQILKDAKLLRDNGDGVKLLGDGALKAAVNFEIEKASKSAVAAVEKSGGSVKQLVVATEETTAKASKAKKSGKADKAE